MSEAIGVRPFETASDYEGMVDYFLGGSGEFLHGMGVDLARLPTREGWLRAVLEDHERPDEEKERLYIAWLHAGEVVGHSSLSHITPGETACCHLHLWRTDLRRSGLGSAFLAASIDIYFDRYDLKTVASEPYAENPGPNRTLSRLGFQRVKTYRTVPSGVAFEQDVHRYEVGRLEWEARRAAK